MCLNNEARLDYEYRFDIHDSQEHQRADRTASGRFVITFSPQK